MPLTKKRELILVESKFIEFTSKQTGDIVKTWRYKFVDKDLKYYIAFDPNGLYANDVCNISEWEQDKAKTYEFVVSEFNGETKEKLYFAQSFLDATKEGRQAPTPKGEAK